MIAGRRGVRALLQAAALLLADGAQAQSSACDQLKGVLAARIDASGVHGYSLEAVPAETPVPSGANASGNCEGGKSKILYRRAGATQALPAPAPALPARPASRAGEVSASAPAARAQAPETAAARRASEVEVARITDPPVAAAAPVAPDKTIDVTAAPAPPEPGLMAMNWRWIGALALLPLAGWFWAWRAHRRAYDEAGLPRGPRL